MSGVELVVDEVTVRFAGLTALDAVSLRVAPGEIHALIGPNGAGKSTCLNVISGVYRVTSGQVLLDGDRIDRLRPHAVAARGVARAFQNVGLGRRQTALDQIMVGRYHLSRAGIAATGLGLPHARRERRAHESRVREIAAYLGISDRLGELVGDLPYGDQKRVDIARALAMEPRLLVLDEPAAGLDHSETRAMAEAIRGLRRDLGLSILLVEHDMGMVMTISDRVTVLDFGRLIADDVPSAVRTDPAVVRAYLGGGGASLADPAVLGDRR